MRSPISGSWLALLAVGALSIILLGAFAPSNPATIPAITSQVGDAPVRSPEPAAETPSEPILSPGLGEIARLARARVGDDTLLAFIRNSGQTYAPSADDLLYLSGLGISQEVIAALYKPPLPGAPASVAGNVEPVQPAISPTPGYFAPVASLGVEPATEMEAALQPVQALPPLDGSSCGTVLTRFVPYPSPYPVFSLPGYIAGDYRYHSAALTASARAAHLGQPILPSLHRVSLPQAPVPPLPPLPPILTRPSVTANSKTGK